MRSMARSVGRRSCSDSAASDADAGAEEFLANGQPLHKAEDDIDGVAQPELFKVASKYADYEATPIERKLALSRSKALRDASLRSG